MTSISNYSLNMPPSPRAMMDKRIGAAVETGTLSQVDGDALETALDSIASALASSATDTGSRLDPSAMKDRIDSLIDDQLASGALTQDQASALQAFFAQGEAGPSASTATDGTSDSMTVDGAQAIGAMGGPRGMRGPPPPPPSAGEGADSDDQATGSTDASSANDRLDSIVAFLENLRSSLAQSLYGTASNGGADSSNSGLVVDSLA